jgi:exopolysaccharide biosynthesis polyprenyl glycosylphosphotransferase
VERGDVSAVTEHAALVQGLELHDELIAAVDDLTLEILERRRRTAVVHRRGWLVRRVLLVADLVGLTTAFLLAEWVISRHAAVGTFDARAEIVAFFVTLPAWVLVAKLYGLYDRDEERTDHSTADDFTGVFHMVTVCAWLFWALTQVFNIAHPYWPKLVIFWSGAICLVSFGRAAARTAARRSPTYLQNTIIVGAGDVGQLVAKKLLQHPEYGINLVGFIDENPKERRDDLGHLALLGGVDRISAVVRLLDVERVIVAFSNEPHERTLELIRELKDLDADLQIDIVPRLFETVGPNVGMHTLEGIPLVGLPPLRLSHSSAFVKRAVDVVVSAVALVVLCPLLAALSIAVKVDSPGPVLYRHARIGRRGKKIEILKFRTMRLEACRGERYGGDTAERAFLELMSDPALADEFDTSYKLVDDPRVTRVGRFLRQSSLDELPQLANVLLGRLSLVGPRAITVSELGRYGDRADELLNTRPGITGYWQINGRSRLGYEDRVRLDLSYISNWSLRLDFTILAKTVRVLLTRQGAV